MMRNTSNRRHLSDAREKAGLDVAIATLGLAKEAWIRCTESTCLVSLVQWTLKRHLPKISERRKH